MAVIHEDLSAPLTYLEEFPRPDPKYDETIFAIPRASSGTNVSVKARKAGRVPSIVFEQEDGQHGGNKRLISVQNNQIKKLVTQLGRSFFLSRLFDLEVRSEFGSGEIIEKVRVLPRNVCFFVPWLGGFFFFFIVYRLEYFPQFCANESATSACRHGCTA